MSEIAKRRSGASASGEDQRRMVDAIHEAVSVARRVLTQAAPHYAWLLTQVPVRALAGPPDLSMATDGREIIAGPRFLLKEGHRNTPEGAIPGEREATVIHEMLHMARCHPQRSWRLESRPGRRFSPMIANVAADAIVNEDMKAWKAGGIVVPDNWIHRDVMVKSFRSMAAAAGIPLPEEISRPIEDSSLEELHDAMVDVLEAHDEALRKRASPCPCCGRKEKAPSPSQEKGEKAESGKGSGKESQEGSSGGSAEGSDEGSSEGSSEGSGKGSGEGSSEGSAQGSGEEPGEGPEGQGPQGMGEWLRPDRLQDIWRSDGDGSDLVQPSVEDCGDAAIEASERAWRERVRESVSRRHGLEPGAGLSKWMEREVDVARWKRALMPLLARHLTPDPEENDRIPSRRTVSAHAAGKPLFWETGIDPFRPGGTLVICIDSSGSVPDAMLSEFASHAMAIGRAFSSPVHMVIGDVRVDLTLEDVHLDRSKAKEALGKGLPGRGGTRFEPLLEKAEELEACVALYLTDGWAEFPPAPPMPVVWAVPPAGREAGDFPYGNVLELRE